MTKSHYQAAPPPGPQKWFPFVAAVTLDPQICLMVVPLSTTRWRWGSTGGRQPGTCEEQEEAEWVLGPALERPELVAGSAPGGMSFCDWVGSCLLGWGFCPAAALCVLMATAPAQSSVSSVTSPKLSVPGPWS